MPVAIALSACSTDSSEVDNQDIYLSIKMTEESPTGLIKINAEFREKHALGNSIILVDGDHLVVSFNGTPEALSEDKDIIDTDYEASIQTEGELGVFNFSFNRTGFESVSFDIDAPASFQISSPQAGDTFYDGETPKLNWSPANPEGQVSVDGHIKCFAIEEDLELDTDNENETWTALDTGSYYVPLAELARNMRFEVKIEDDVLLTSKACEFDIKLSRENTTYLSDYFASNSKVSMQKYDVVKNMKFYINGFD